MFSIKIIDIKLLKVQKLMENKNVCIFFIKNIYSEIAHKHFI